MRPSLGFSIPRTASGAREQETIKSIVFRSVYNDEREDTTVIERSDDEWRSTLSPEQYAVLRQAGTEAPWTGALLDEKRAGLYTCGACGAELFRSGTKFDSGCGWPSFYETVRPEAVTLIEDTSHGMVRTEVRCATCGSHLGHVFPDGFGTPTGDRYCMNSVALEFTLGENV